MNQTPLIPVIECLQAHYGRQRAPRLNGPWEMVLWENVAYLADDEQRRRAFQVLTNRIGTTPRQILAASEEALLEVTRHGILPDQFAKKLRACAKIASETFHGDLQSVLDLPLPKARKALQKFPGIGEPGAEKILLLTGAQRVLALESNGLRVLLRLGYGEEKKSYSTTYRLVQKAATAELGGKPAELIQAHLLLRRHGQGLCRRTDPLCSECPLTENCAFFQQGRDAAK